MSEALPQSHSHYTGAEGRAYQEQKRAIPPEAIPWVARLRAEKIAPYVHTGDVVFEFGAGYGWNLAALECARKVAHDLSDFLAPELEKQGIEFVHSTSTLPDHFADVVICHHTLEHVPNPPAILAELRRLMKPSARLLLFVPFEKERRYRRYDPAEPNHHLYSWNVQTLGNLVSECGLRLVNAGVGRFGYDRFAAKLAVRFPLGEPGFRLVRRMVHLWQPGLEVRVVAERSSGSTR